MVEIYNGKQYVQQPAETLASNREDPKQAQLNHDALAKQLYAGFGIRLLSYIIDILVLFGIKSLILTPIYHFTHIDEVELFIPYLDIDHILDALFFYLYFVLMTKYFKQTLGKMICNIRVERIDRQRLTWSDVLFREWIGRIISGLFLNLPYLVIAFTNKHRGIHDYVADTVVIRNKLEHLFYMK
ncbi:RDD family protein [Staphylococcus auricularis]|uniref:RDD family protein n=1 Tax=Staphylococcus auricularis TaxID=29379 RepID=UPI0024304F81|nr:RDD family protein [Staphylococcus auricularis]